MGVDFADRDGEGAEENPVQYSDVAEVFLQLLESDETEAGRVYWARGARSRSRRGSRSNVRSPRSAGARPPVTSPGRLGESSRSSSKGLLQPARRCPGRRLARPPLPAHRQSGHAARSLL